MKMPSIIALTFLLLAGTSTAVAQLNYTTGVSYDELGQMENFTYPDGSWVSYVYDNEIGVSSQVTYECEGDRTDLVRSIVLNESGLVEHVAIDGGEKHYAYDSLSQLVEMRFEHGGVTHYQATGMAYNHLGGLKSLIRQDSSVNAAIHYGYTEQGQLRTFALGGATATYRYDARGNLTSVDGFTSGQLQVPDQDAGSQAFDAGNHRVDWEYDTAGRLLKDDTRQYYYDATGRLAMVRDLATGLPLQTNLYDGAGNRIRSSDILAGSVTYSIRDAAGAVVTEVVDKADQPDLTTNYVQHSGRAIAKMTRPAGSATVQKTQIVTDHLGSPAVTIADNLVRVHEYGPFGIQLGLPEYTGAHGYTGHDDDAATALTYMMARHYDSAMARFLTPDPAREFDPFHPSGYNLYQYVYNDPLNLLDPTGLGPQTGREWAVTKAHQSFASRNEITGYAYMGLSGLLGTADGISKVVNFWVFGAQDELTAGDYGAAALNGLEVIPALKWTKLKNIGKVADAAGDAFGNARSATRIALGGGRHAGQFKAFLKQTPDQLKRSIKSFDMQITKHKDWIKNPKSKISNFDSLTKKHQKNIIHHWKKDIKRQKEFKIIAEDVLEEVDF